MLPVLETFKSFYECKLHYNCHLLVKETENIWFKLAASVSSWATLDFKHLPDHLWPIRTSLPLFGESYLGGRATLPGSRGAFWLSNCTSISFKGGLLHTPDCSPPRNIWGVQCKGDAAKSLCSPCEVTTATMCTIRPWGMNHESTIGPL